MSLTNPPTLLISPKELTSFPSPEKPEEKDPHRAELEEKLGLAVAIICIIFAIIAIIWNLERLL